MNFSTFLGTRIFRTVVRRTSCPQPIHSPFHSFVSITAKFSPAMSKYFYSQWNLPEHPVSNQFCEMRAVRHFKYCDILLKYLLRYHIRVLALVSGYGPDERGVRVRVPVESTIFTSPLLFFWWPTLRPIQPPIQWILEALSPGVKRLGSEADHSPPTSAKVKKTWVYTSTAPYAFIA
jgi:hypothetical protein